MTAENDKGLKARPIAMPQSVSLVVVHLIFSTKDRHPVLDPDLRPKVHAYLATVARGIGCEAYRVGGMADHVHLAIRLSRTVALADLVQELKTASSKWVKNAIAGPGIIFVATGLCLFFGGAVGFGGIAPIHRSSGRASPDEDVSGRVPGVFE
jgi:REP element-mobilizing transposase RayT